MIWNKLKRHAPLWGKWLFVLLLIPMSKIATAQLNADTLTIGIKQAERTFLQKNLQLLASQYNIDAYQALIQQAVLWDNPNINTDQNLYDGQGGFFKHSDGLGTFYAQVTQLIKTAGKRSKLAQLATDNTNLAKAQFEDVLRSLHYTLVSDLLKMNSLIKSR